MDYLKLWVDNELKFQPQKHTGLGETSNMYNHRDQKWINSQTKRIVKR